MKQVAVITGSNGRIGQATCQKLAESGYLSVGIDIGDIDVRGGAGGNWPHYACDVTDLPRLAETLARIEAEHGRIRVLFNNAGVYHSGADFFETTPELYAETMDINVRAPFFATQWVARRLIDAKEGGAIVTTASLAGQAGSSVVDYGASKAAVINMTKSLGRALGPHNIRVNAIAPGLIETAMGARVPAAVRERAKHASALRRVGEAAEIASVVAFLVSDAASYITCSTIDVNGGL